MKLKGIACGALLALVSFAPNLAAAPIGTLAIDSVGNGVTVTNTSIDWLPLGGGDGDMITGATTNIVYVGGGPLVPFTLGTIKDLPPVPPVTDFMTFAGHPNLSFDLAGIGPGSANFNCAGLNAVGQSCSVSALSPFVLTYMAPNLITVSLTAFGTATDLTGTSNWIGAFSTQLGMSAAAVQTLFLGNPNASVTSTYSGTFTATFVPEPVTMLLFGLGLTGVAYRARRRS